MKKISEEKKELAFALHQQGVPSKIITDKTGVNREYIRQIVLRKWGISKNDQLKRKIENLNSRILSLYDRDFSAFSIGEILGIRGSTIERIQNIVESSGRKFKSFFKERKKHLSIIRQNNLDEILELYGRGFSTLAIGRKFKISSGTVRNIIQSSGKKIRSIEEVQRFGKEQSLKKALFLFDNGVLMGEIRKRTGLSDPLIRAFLTENRRLTRKIQKEKILRDSKSLILSFWEKGLLISHICEKVNLSASFVTGILKKNSKIRVPYFQDIKFTTEEKDIILGNLLGDASITKSSSATARVMWAYNHESYALFLHEKLKRLTHYEQPKKIDFYHCNICNKTYYSILFSCPQCNTRMSFLSRWSFASKSLVSLKEMYTLTKDKNGRKTISRAWLEQLSPLSLAVWYMDDGSKAHKTVEIATCCFNYFEHQSMRDYFWEKWGIKTTIQGKKYLRLYFSISTVGKFIDLIQPYIPNCMRYKLV